MNVFYPQMATATILKRKTNAYRRYTIKAAYDLGYGEGVIEQLKTAQTENEIDKIMAETRRKTFA